MSASGIFKDVTASVPFSLNNSDLNEIRINKYSRKTVVNMPHEQSRESTWHHCCLPPIHFRFTCLFFFFFFFSADRLLTNKLKKRKNPSRSHLPFLAKRTWCINNLFLERAVVAQTHGRKGHNFMTLEMRARRLARSLARLCGWKSSRIFKAPKKHNDDDQRKQRGFFSWVRNTDRE